MPKAPQQLLGLWDLRTMPVSLGGVITFVGDLHTRAAGQRERLGGVCFVGDDAHRLASLGPPEDGAATRLDDKVCAAVPSLAALLSLEGIDSLYYGHGLHSARLLIEESLGGTSTWPQLGVSDDGAISYEYGTTFNIQDAYAALGEVTSFGSKEPALRWAHTFLVDQVRPATAVAVHLRNQSGAQSGSNADLVAWAGFIGRAQAFNDVCFVLLGNEELGDVLPGLSNVILSRDFGATIAEDLALVQICDAFMGMASGPCNMAIFTDRPYVIFKNPTDHAEHIQREIGDAERFSFAMPNQKLLRVSETDEWLMAEFEALYAAVGGAVPAQSRRARDN